MDIPDEPTTLNAQVTIPSPKLILRKALILTGAAAGLFIGIGAYEHLRNKRQNEIEEEIENLFVTSELPDAQL